MLRWWPHVAVDLHEMGANSTYFFPPPMAPVNKNVQPTIIRWWDVYAAANAEAFDRHGWSYFRREGYDEFYPGYGSSWPLYAGAIGMTYERPRAKRSNSPGRWKIPPRMRRGTHTTAWATVARHRSQRRSAWRDYLAYRRSAVTTPTPSRARRAHRRDAYARADRWRVVSPDNGIIVGLGARSMCSPRRVSRHSPGAPGTSRPPT